VIPVSGNEMRNAIGNEEVSRQKVIRAESSFLFPDSFSGRPPTTSGSMDATQFLVPIGNQERGSSFLIPDFQTKS
jgi:hypothetical protein